MDDLTLLVQRLQAFFGAVADQLALQARLRTRPSRAKLDGPRLLKALVGGWWRNPKASRAELGALVGVSKQAIDQALNQTTANFLKLCLDWAVSQVVAVQPQAPALLERFQAVYLFDSSVVSLPAELSGLWLGCGQPASASSAGLKLHVGLELVSGALVGPHLTSARTHDRSGPHHRLALAPHSLRICDLGYWDLERLAELEQQDCYYLSRVAAGTQLQLGAVGGESAGSEEGWQSIGEYLSQCEQDQLDCEVRVGKARHLKGRLVAYRVSQQVLTKRQLNFKALEAKRQRPVSREQQHLSEWSVYFTNLPDSLVKAEEVVVLYRLRWQLELLFKNWKSGGAQLEQWHSAKPWAILGEVYAKLLGAIITHWVGLEALEQAEGQGLWKVTRLVRMHAPAIVARLGQAGALREALEYVRVDLRAQARLEAGYKRPNSYQLRLKPPLLI